MPLDAHKVFCNSSEQIDFLTRLTLEKKTKNDLRAARDEIREAIREGLRNWQEQVSKAALFEFALQSVEPPALKPKFRMQGSFAYHTCNVPAQCPPQEIDLDDGLFLPISFLTSNGERQPAVVSHGLFLAVERALEPLCKRNGWVLNKTKHSCVRVELNRGAHIDIALYAVPDETYEQLLEKAAHAQGISLTDQAYQTLREARDLTDEVYRALPTDQIMLAHRREGWKPSDPRKLEDWFREAVDRYGEQLRRVCRYFKGWRDYHWDSCRMASIALMAAVVRSYEEAQETLPAHRDDLGLLMVAERLPEILSDIIANPVVEGQRLDEGWNPEQRQEFITEAEHLLRRLQDALLGTDDPKVAIASLNAAFGPRIPDDPDLISSESAEAPSKKSAFPSPTVLRSSQEQMAASIAALDEAEKYRRAEAAAREVEARGSVSKPWSR